MGDWRPRRPTRLGPDVGALMTNARPRRNGRRGQREGEEYAPPNLADSISRWTPRCRLPTFGRREARLLDRGGQGDDHGLGHSWAELPKHEGSRVLLRPRVIARMPIYFVLNNYRDDITLGNRQQRHARGAVELITLSCRRRRT
jgi:hypothetical protein